jgi:hypothetical protein
MIKSIKLDNKEIVKEKIQNSNIYERGIFDLNLLQFVIVSENTHNIKKVLQVLKKFEVKLHICN